jgi:hypothetical protein
MNYAVICSSIVTAAATVVLAFVAYYNHRLVQSMNTKSEQRDQEVRDLMQALVLAELLGPIGAESLGTVVKRFKNAYKGKTPIILE